METTSFPSCVLLHDGDFDRAIVLRTTEKDSADRHAVIVTRATLEDALRDQPGCEKIVLSGPCGFSYDRLAATRAPEHMVLVSGDCPTQTVQVAREDIVQIVVRHRTAKMVKLLGALAVPQEHLQAILGQLDEMAAQLQKLEDICAEKGFAREMPKSAYAKAA